MTSDLVGREDELRWIATIVQSALDERGASGLLVGEAGIGKSALLHAASALLAGGVVSSVAGVETEREIPFGALQRLVLPHLAIAQTLPDKQRDALLVALGMEVGRAADTTLVGLAMLSLLSTLSQTAPVLCLIDDVQWVDAESVSVLAFVARRIHAERVALLFACRAESANYAALSGIAQLEVSGLGLVHSIELLGRSVSVAVDPRVAERIARAADGNPLALIDVSADLSPSQLSGQSSISDPIGPGPHLEGYYARQTAALPKSTQEWLVVAASEPSARPDLVEAASRRLGIADGASRDAELAGLVTITDEIRFRHPLVRSAIYTRAISHDVRRAHSALAELALARGNRDAWVAHSSASTLGPDDELADELEAAADRATLRGGYMSRTTLLLKSAGFSSATDVQMRRTLSALESSIIAGAAYQASAIAESLHDFDLDDITRASLLASDSEIAVLLTRDSAFALRPAALLQAATLFHEANAPQAKSVIAHAYWALFAAESRVRDVDATTIAEASLAIAANDDDLVSKGLRAIATLITEGPEAATPLVNSAVTAAIDRSASGEDLLKSIACLALASHAVRDLDGRDTIMNKAESLAREIGALSVLTRVLIFRAHFDAQQGQARRGRRRLAEAADLMMIMGVPQRMAKSLIALPSLSESTGESPVDVAELERVDYGLGLAYPETAAMMFALAHGEFTRAWDFSGRGLSGPLTVRGLMLADVAEIALRAGAPESPSLIARFQREAEANPTAWAKGLRDRLRALASSGETAADQYESSISQLSSIEAPVDLARARLYYGEWLRRHRRRTEARAQLLAALDLFEIQGATAWAQRVRRELTALGEAGYKATRPSFDLTPQEFAVATLAASGSTNSEIASRLFVSPSTVDFHLRKVFRKVGVTSRRQLRSVELE